MVLDDTGLPWVAPSPNLRTLTEAVLYPGVALVEGANVSVGRGTDAPFELVGAPWISGERLARYLNGRCLSGVVFEARELHPRGQPLRPPSLRGRPGEGRGPGGPECGGPGGRVGRPRCTGFIPGSSRSTRTVGMIGSRRVLQAIKNGDDPKVIQQKWQPGLEAFGRLRARYLLY